MKLPMDLERKNILLCAIGGGFDIFGTLPLLYELCSKNNIWLSSFSLNKIGHYFDYTSDVSLDLDYFPERLFSLSTKLPVSFIGKCGAVPLRKYYNSIIKNKEIDIIITVVCGIDSLMFGDEVYKGTITEEYVNFSALRNIDIEKYHVCFGFGSEAEEKISHYRVLENISTITKQGGFIGSCSLVSGDNCFQYYKTAYQFVEDYEGHKKSHIHPRIIKSIEGEFGNKNISAHTIMKATNADVFLSVIMGQYWFFDFNILVSNIPVLDKLQNHQAFVESISEISKLPKIRDNKVIPL